jgi:murein DD-endopeptidase MepM/ murein hydrolase activator NlpD
MLITFSTNDDFRFALFTKILIFVKHKLLKKVIFIISISCIGFINLNAISPSGYDEKRPGDDKKSKAKREDSTKFVVNHEVTNDETDISPDPDTSLILFPSHDLYSSWDTETAHPYNFNESFKEDSVVIDLTGNDEDAFVMPYKGPLTSLFGWRKYRPHFGTDINLETGDTVVASFDGMVRVARAYHGYGNCVIVRHNNGLETVYAHLSKLLVESGTIVKAGTTLGLGGNTGHSYGSHLHFEIRYLGQALDAQDFIDFDKGTLKSNTFVLRKLDVENKYDLRALRARYKRDLGLGRGRHYSVHAGKNGIYKVRKGDTLARIAKRNGTTVRAICKKNHLKTTSTLRVGQKLKVY